MRRIKEALRLRYACGLGIRQVARGLGLSHSTVSELLQRAVAAGLTWPLPEDLDEAALEAKLYLGNPEGQPDRPTPDWDNIHLELRRKGVTLQLLCFLSSTLSVGHVIGRLRVAVHHLRSMKHCQLGPCVRSEPRPVAFCFALHSQPRPLHM